MGGSEKEVSVFLGGKKNAKCSARIARLRSMLRKNEKELDQIRRGKIPPIAVPVKVLVMALAYELRHDLRYDEGLTKHRILNCLKICRCETTSSCILENVPSCKTFTKISKFLKRTGHLGLFLSNMHLLCKCYWSEQGTSSDADYIEALLRSIS